MNLPKHVENGLDIIEARNRAYKFYREQGWSYVEFATAWQNGIIDTSKWT